MLAAAPERFKRNFWYRTEEKHYWPLPGLLMAFAWPFDGLLMAFAWSLTDLCLASGLKAQHCSVFCYSFNFGLILSDVNTLVAFSWPLRLFGSIAQFEQLSLSVLFKGSLEL